MELWTGPFDSFHVAIMSRYFHFTRLSLLDKFKSSVIAVFNTYYVLVFFITLALILLTPLFYSGLCLYSKLF